MVVQTIVHFEIPAKDVRKLSAFYARCFGWKFTSTHTPGLEYWLISTGPRGRSVGGGMYSKTDPQDVPRNFIHVAKIDPAIKKFKAAGGKEVVGKMEVPGMGWSFIGADPEGNLIALWEPNMGRPARPATRSVSRRTK
jgi:hypothetical protein